jgi:hypothetical protein
MNADIKMEKSQINNDSLEDLKKECGIPTSPSK